MTGSSIPSTFPDVTGLSSVDSSISTRWRNQPSTHDLTSFSDLYAQERRSIRYGEDDYRDQMMGELHQPSSAMSLSAKQSQTGGLSSTCGEPASSISHDELTSPTDTKSSGQAQSQPSDAQEPKSDESRSVRNREPAGSDEANSEKKNQSSESQKNETSAEHGGGSGKDVNTDQAGKTPPPSDYVVSTDQQHTPRTASGSHQVGSSSQTGLPGQPVGIESGGGGVGGQSADGSNEQNDQRSSFLHQGKQADQVSRPATVSSSNGSAFLASIGSRSSEGMMMRGATSASTDTGSGDSTTTTQAKEFSPQVIRGLMSVFRTGGGAVTMRLEPESLGPLRVQMSMNQGRVSIQFHAATSEARSLLHQSMETLRSTLEQSGLKVDQVTIQPLSRQTGPDMNGQQQNMNRDSSEMENQQHDAAGGRSRGYQQYQSTGDERNRSSSVDQSSDQIRNQEFDQVLNESQTDVRPLVP